MIITSREGEDVAVNASGVSEEGCSNIHYEYWSNVCQEVYKKRDPEYIVRQEE